ncbi:hypothetical protein VTL71DRAFT_10295, partial [Oculimacula yallundae]
MVSRDGDDTNSFARIRRVKCDEGKPICSRCVKFGIACDGYSRQSRTPSPRSRSLGPTLAPRIRAPSLPSIGTPLANEFGTVDSGRYFNVFRDQTSFQMTPFFDAESFRTFILQASIVPSIRHLIVAIGALAQSSMIFHQRKNDASIRLEADQKAHHRVAFQEYSKALKLMREASSEGRQDLRMILISSLLIACFESAHGNFKLADAQIESGLTLLDSWRTSHPSVDSQRSIFSSPSPNEVDDILFQIFSGLEIQSSSFSEKHTAEQHRQIMYEGEEDVQNMPVQFANCHEARLYLELMVRRLLHWMYSVELSHSPEMEDSNTGSNNFQEGHVDDMFLYDITTGRMGKHLNLQFEQIHYLSQLERWNSAFDSFLQHSPIPEWDLTSNQLRLGSKACGLLLNTVVGQENISLEQDRANVEDMLRLSRAVLEGLRTESMTRFTVLQGPIDSCRLEDVLRNPSQQYRKEAIDIFSRSPRFEGTAKRKENTAKPRLVAGQQTTIPLSEAQRPLGQCTGNASPCKIHRFRGRDT